MKPIYILGGYQTDFAQNWSREGATLFELMSSAVGGALDHTNLETDAIETTHIGNFTGELFSGQGHLGGVFASIDDAFIGLPTARHEAACASGAVAALAATAELEADRYEVACVLGVEQMRNVDGTTAADHLGAAAWRGHEGQDAQYVWPHLFNRILEEYRRRYGLDYRHLMAIAEKNFGNAKKNPHAQTRRWNFGPDSFTTNDAANPAVEGSIRRHDCSQITDGAAAVILATAEFAHSWAKRRGKSLDDIPHIAGWGHRTAAMSLQEKLAVANDDDYLFPHVRHTVTDAWRRAQLGGIDEIDAIELHDCFTITEYMLTEHFGLAGPGQAWKAIEEGVTSIGGKTPVNASGGLIGGGHPVGATGVRMLLDAYRQVTATAGDYQVDGARTVQTMNLGGSATTSVSFVVRR